MNRFQRSAVIFLGICILLILIIGCEINENNSINTSLDSTATKPNLPLKSKINTPINSLIVSSTKALSNIQTYKSTEVVPITKTTPSYPYTVLPIKPGIKLNFSVLPEIRGILYLGNATIGTYYKVDLLNGVTWLGSFNPQCVIFKDGLHVICNSSSGWYIMNLEEKKLDRLPDSRWFITPSEKLLYTGSIENGELSSITIRNVEDGKQHEITYTDAFLWGSLPSLSDDGKYILGIVTIASNPVLKMALFDTTTLNTIIVYQQKGSTQPTDNIAWANDEDVAVIAGTDETITGESFSCYNNSIFKYDVVSNSIKTLFHFPDGKCFDMFLLHYPWLKYANNDIWSPNNQNIVLVSNQREICIIEVDTGAYECYAPQTSLGRISTISWSPDSAWLAYNTTENHVILFSLKDTQFIDLGDMGSLNIDWVVWTSAKN